MTCGIFDIQRSANQSDSLYFASFSSSSDSSRILINVNCLRERKKDREIFFCTRFFSFALSSSHNCRCLTLEHNHAIPLWCSICQYCTEFCIFYGQHWVCLLYKSLIITVSFWRLSIFFSLSLSLKRHKEKKISTKTC